MISFIDLQTGSRGLDIKGLKKVIILLPAYLRFEDAKFTMSDLKQSIGRVGRNGTHG